MSEETPEPSAESYLVLLNENEKSLAAYVHTLVPNLADADDIIQSCKIVMWKHFGSFSEGTNFLAWARKIALNQILNYRRSEKRRDRFSQNPAFVESIARELDSQTESPDRRSEALHQCLQKLPDAHRKLILLRYYEDRDIGEIAILTKRTDSAVYRLLSRVRASLSDCISNTLSPSAL